MTGFDLPGTEKDAARIAELEADLEAYQSALDACRTERDHARAELVSARQELDRLRGEVDGVRAALAERQDHVDDLEGTLAVRDRELRTWRSYGTGGTPTDTTLTHD